MNNIQGTGAIKSTYDIRDDWYEPIGRGAFDWSQSFDIETLLNTKLVTKDQGKSSSCGGQAWAYYGEVLEAVATKVYDPQSARWVYSHTFVPGGGSAGRTNCDFVVNNGYARESDAPSYLDGLPPTEQFMEKVPVLSDNADEERDVSRVASYLQVPIDIDLIAQAVMQNYGAVIMVGAQNNGTWRSAYPAIPVKEEWWHWLYVGKLKTLNSKKYLGVKNSWGDIGENGWQWLSEDWIKNIHEVWTLQWDYQRPVTKKILQAQIPLLKQIISLLNQLLSLKHPSQG